MNVSAVDSINMVHEFLFSIHIEFGVLMQVNVVFIFFVIIIVVVVLTIIIVSMWNCVGFDCICA